MCLTLHILLEEDAQRVQDRLYFVEYVNATLALGLALPAGLIGAPAVAPPLTDAHFAAARMGTFSTQPPTPTPSPPRAHHWVPVPVDMPAQEPAPHAGGLLASRGFDEFESTRDQPMRCPICARTYPSKYLAKKHYMRYHYTGVKRQR